ncbi:MAG TPA: hypothetical protein VK121_04345 [Pseudogracilibacillus sp.]|nr:hypothetical protein [Pseudogracilibacillus sp.]
MIASDARVGAMEINYLVKLGRMLTNVNAKAVIFNWLDADI